VYLYYIALGQQQDLGHGSAGAVILAAIIAVFTLLQGRIVGFGEQSARDSRRERRARRRAVARA
jgi:multiple sugar transport system permease protein